MEEIFLSMGGNQTETPSAFLRAFNEIQTHVGKISALSSVYITEPLVSEGIDPTSIAPYYNLVAKVLTHVTPFSALASVLKIEKQLGRIRDPNNRYAPRVIDIDIILWGSLILEEKSLTIPHPEMHKRDFVLQPLIDIDSSLMHPQYNKTIEELLSSLSKKFIIKKV